MALPTPRKDAQLVGWLSAAAVVGSASGVAATKPLQEEQDEGGRRGDNAPTGGSEKKS